MLARRETMSEPGVGPCSSLTTKLGSKLSQRSHSGETFIICWLPLSLSSPFRPINFQSIFFFFAHLFRPLFLTVWWWRRVEVVPQTTSTADKGRNWQKGWLGGLLGGHQHPFPFSARPRVTRLTARHTAHLTGHDRGLPGRAPCLSVINHQLSVAPQGTLLPRQTFPAG